MGYAEGDCTREPTRTIDDAIDESEEIGFRGGSTQRRLTCDDALQRSKPALR